jgi:UDP-N-acetyl-D-mannosaminuronic acid dehydrogenase
MKIYGKSAIEVSEAFRNGQVTVAVFGLGKMGLPLAALFADSGAKVIGADISSAVADGINSGKNHIKEEPGLSELVEKNVNAGRLRATTDLASAAKESDVKIILVPTLIKNHKPDLTPVYAVAESISKGLSPGDIVITECTMPPGSTEELIPLLERGGLIAGKDYGIGHCPERTMTGTAIADIRGKYPKIVGAIDEKTKNALVGIYSVINSKGVIPVSGIRAAELVKVFEGVYRDVNIGLANELTGVCEKSGVSYMEVQKAANTQPFCHLHTPGGVGGHCIPYYPYFIMDEDTVITLTARHVNEHMPNRIINKAKDALLEKGKNIKTANVLVLGIAFRGGVKETIKSTSLEVIAKLKKEAGGVYAYDPLYTKEETEKFGVSYQSSYKDIDCIIVMADHKEFSSCDWKKIATDVRTKALVDAKQVVDPKTARDAGFSYRGVGFN